MVVLVVSLSASLIIPIAHARAQLKAGNWWTLNGTYKFYGNGTGTDQGYYVETGAFLARFQVTALSLNGSVITIQETWSGKYICHAAGNVWNCSPQTSWTFSHTRILTISLKSMDVTSNTKDGNSESWAVGQPNWWLLNTTKLSNGGTAPYVWCVPTEDDKNCVANGTTVQASISTASTTVKNSSINAWLLTYTGPTLGQFTNSLQQYSIGTETDRALYDPTYGILLGGTYNQTAKGHESNFQGEWIDGYFEQDIFSDSNLVFSATLPVPEFQVAYDVLALVALFATVIILRSSKTRGTFNKPLID
jgi:hypothetical protein